jgi:predicted site-specific integrase-resolvase
MLINLSRLISLRETATTCNVCEETLLNWRRSGWLVPAFNKFGRIAYDRRDVERFLRDGGPKRNKPGRKPDKEKEGAQ